MNRPRVSCIMPTANRRAFVPLAIACFVAQDRDDAELLVIDNGRDDVADLIPADPRIAYVREGGRRTLGAWRNLACGMAVGDVVMHWDDDDWYPPDRIARQLAVFDARDVDVCGSSRLYFVDRGERRAWEYAYRDARRPWVAGQTLAYRRAYWQRHRFADLQVGEDSRFVWSDPSMRLFDLDDPTLCVAAIHAANTSRKRPSRPFWRAIDPSLIKALVDETVDGAAMPASKIRATASRRVRIGIHADADVDRLEATLRCLAALDADTTRITVLGDGVDAAFEQVVAARGLELSCTAAVRGAAACFNRLIGDPHADLYVFLEGGAMPGAGWLDKLRAALDAGPAHGLAGPSTNHAWNVQALFRDRRCSAGDVPVHARLAHERHGDTWQSLDELHCLADFCYAVRREVVDAIGLADERYGAGPCWEMDYTVRAARAGFKAVWAKGAYVFRPHFTARRERDEALLMEANKHRYQDKFCGLRLAGARTSYGAHCAGDACPHFAPADAMAQARPRDTDAIDLAIVPAVVDGRTRAPLISCIMPTRDRLDWLLQSIAYFQRQDYPARELIVVDDGAQPVQPHLPCDPRIRCVRVSRRMSIGAKRNLACEQASGELIAHWDDDDWYAPTRLSTQAARLLDDTADMTAFDETVFFDLEGWRFWACDAATYRRLFVAAVHGGTLLFRRSLHDRVTRYPDASLAEDAAFLTAAVARGARLRSMPAADQYLYLRHGANSWRLTREQSPGRPGWRQVAEPDVLAADRDFYLARRRHGAPAGQPCIPNR